MIYVSRFELYFSSSADPKYWGLQSLLLLTQVQCYQRSYVTADPPDLRISWGASKLELDRASFYVFLSFNFRVQRGSHIGLSWSYTLVELRI